MSELIECCYHNGDRSVNEFLLESGFDVDVRFCLDRCDECYRSSFLVVDGEPMTDTSHERLLERIEESEPTESQ